MIVTETLTLFMFCELFCVLVRLPALDMDKRVKRTVGLICRLFVNIVVPGMFTLEINYDCCVKVG